MSITKISSDGYSYGNLDLYSALSASQTSNDDTQTKTSIIDTSKTTKSDSFNISGPAEFFNRLQQLKDTDPEKFKEVCKEIAEKLRSAAQTIGVGSGANTLSSLADKFENAAETGDLSQFKPTATPTYINSTQSAASIYSQNSQLSLVDIMNSSDKSGSASEIDRIIASVLNKANGTAQV